MQILDYIHVEKTDIIIIINMVVVDDNDKCGSRGG